MKDTKQNDLHINKWIEERNKAAGKLINFSWTFNVIYGCVNNNHYKAYTKPIKKQFPPHPQMFRTLLVFQIVNKVCRHDMVA